jgi:hypothetical protein
MDIAHQTLPKKVVIPVEAEIQSFQRSLDAGRVRHDGLIDFMNRN